MLLETIWNLSKFMKLTCEINKLSIDLHRQINDTGRKYTLIKKKKQKTNEIKITLHSHSKFLSFLPLDVLSAILNLVISFLD